ncbi:uncharacterized protein MONOS_10947 [Monocercomonoides exilis]|uniref:uncharacterized protein n=1 Tax=Monocercomonoides exilis TaxID=2049356 RepID=UPI0035597DC7|nr:hypothetical protein MONOS_10947 [Monocercomonoides exilis]|eukprot:MONOS_10947.1-p1 / transcript=MONOS_10947.1 / gene=MONOS_10947 / organism=Monocercomonoides_exilis_PA203 / gene_product=unspecified product / transcript_product=unspecified product / location=Mono_scaffold00520:44717-45544(+) / protein_length=201 / sequence_SO=supercontig / SO=protein_coding / is_pseudo=false
MSQLSQFSTFLGITPSTEAAGLPGRRQSQMNIQSQSQLLSPPFINHSAGSENQLPVKENAGYKQKMCLCQAFKAVMFCYAEMDSNKESARQRVSNTLILEAKTFQEARNTRIQGRFGFKAAEKIRAEAAAGLSTSGQEKIQKKYELETELSSSRRRHRSFEAMLEAIKEKRDFYSSSPVHVPSKGGAGQKFLRCIPRSFS